MDRTDRTDRTDDESSAKGTDAEREREQGRHRADERELDRDAQNPPRTSTGRMTAPKFGSATSGGGEIEPGPERD
jgi:hypothetical protein